MKCISCKIEVPAQWTHALVSNMCPSCGKNIMDEVSKNLLSELKGAIAKMPNDPEGLAGWLLSNYKLRKTGSAEPAEFHRPNEDEPVKEAPIKIAVRKDLQNAESGQSIQSKERTNVFVKRSGVDPAKIKSAVDEIKRSSSEGIYAEDPSDFEEKYEDETYDDMVETNISSAPLNRSEINNIEDIFEDSLPPVTSKTINMQELKRLQLQQDGGVGTIRRSS